MRVQTIQNGVNEYAGTIRQGMVHNCRQTVCNFISRDARNVDFGAVPISAEIALIHGDRQAIAANPNRNPNLPPTNPNQQGVGAGVGAAASHGTADAVQVLSSVDAPRAAAPAAILCAEL